MKGIESIMPTNADIRVALITNGIKQYQLAERLGIFDTALSRKLRHELPEDEKSHILAIIDEMAKKAV